MTLDARYRELLRRVITRGHDITRRNGPTTECVNVCASWPASFGILGNAERAMRMDFAKAEALWILDGRNDLGPLVAVLAKLGDYSDNGHVLAGAYGPRWAAQRAYVLDTLRDNPHSRQAVATIWEPRPSASKDIPCTVSWQFMQVEGRLDMFVNMRSSDAWLGLPYDAFTWSVILIDTAMELGLPIGNVHYSATTLHLYAQHRVKAKLAVWSGGASLPQFPAFRTRAELRAWLSDVQ